MTNSALTRERNIYLLGILGTAAYAVVFTLIPALRFLRDLDITKMSALAVPIYVTIRLSRFLRQPLWLTLLFAAAAPFQWTFIIPIVALLIAVRKARKSVQPGVGIGIYGGWRDRLALAVIVIGYILFITCELVGGVECLRVVNSVAGFWGFIAAILIIPATLTLVPWYALLIRHSWSPLLYVYGGLGLQGVFFLLSALLAGGAKLSENVGMAARPVPYPNQEAPHRVEQSGEEGGLTSP